MIEENEDTLDINFILNVIDKEDWVSEELLMLYEQTYRELKRVAVSFELETVMIDQARNELMKKYGQI
jgi:hypothetical protein